MVNREAPPKEQRFRGIVLRLVSVFGYAIMAATLQVAGRRGVDGIELIFYRNVFAFPLLICWIAVGPGFGTIKTSRPGAHLTRSGIGLVTMSFNIYALTLLPLAEAITLSFAAPLFATSLSALFLKESIDAYRWTAVAIGFAGVLLVMQPGGHAIPAVGLTAALCGALGLAFVAITIRQIGFTEPAGATVFWYNVISIAVYTPLMLFHASAHDVRTWAILIVAGTSGSIAQLAMTASLRFAPVSVLTPFDYFQLVVACAIGWMIWNDRPAIWTILGGALIVTSGLLTAWREHRLGRMVMQEMPATGR